MTCKQQLQFTRVVFPRDDVFFLGTIVSESMLSNTQNEHIKWNKTEAMSRALYIDRNGIGKSLTDDIFTHLLVLIAKSRRSNIAKTRP